MTMHDRVLQDAYRAWMAKSDPSAHLDEAAWERLAANELDRPERDAALSHVFACAECAEVWRSLLALRHDAEAERLIAPADRAPVSLWRSRFMPLALAATVSLAVAGVFLAGRPAPVSTVSRGDDQALVEGLTSQASAGSATFAWTGIANATQYRVRMFTEDGQPVWSITTTAPQAQWPAGIEAAPGKYKWRVEVVTDGSVVARSRFTDIEVAR